MLELAAAPYKGCSAGKVFVRFEGQDIPSEMAPSAIGCEWVKGA